MHLYYLFFQCESPHLPNLSLISSYFTLVFSSSTQFKPNFLIFYPPSRYPRETSAPSWHLDKTCRPGGLDKIEKEIKEHQEGKNYTSHDVKTGKEINWNDGVRGNVPWEKSPMRQTQTSELMKEYLFIKEDLDLEPTHTSQSKYVYYSIV